MSLLKKIKNFILFSLLISFSMSQPTQATQFNYYADLAGDWSEIFPDQNRNAAGPKFFKHILGKKITTKILLMIGIKFFQTEIEMQQVLNFLNI